MRRTVSDLLHATKGKLLSGFPKDFFDRVSIDTRTSKPGDLFVALQGPRYDGHQFLRTAADRGASVLMIKQGVPIPSFDPDRVPAMVEVEDTLVALQNLALGIRSASEAEVIGLTGSNGKTTTKEMIASILRQVSPTLSTRGNLNNHIGLPLTLCELEREHRFAIIEMGTSKKGDMDVLVAISRPRVGLITNVGKDHLEFLGTPEGVLEVNRKLFDVLPAQGTAVINLDDPLLAKLKGKLKCREVTYGDHADAMVRATNATYWPLPMKFTLHFGEKSFPAEIHAAGGVQIVNAVAAAATAWAVGVPAEIIVAGLKAFRPASMRWQVHERGDGAVLINDAYNANPSSVRASVRSFLQTYPGKLHWVVLGDMRELGGLARQEHAELGRWLATLSIDRILLYGRDVRFIAEGLSRAGASSRAERFRKKRLLLKDLESKIGAAKPVILFKASRSLRLEQVVQPLMGKPVAAAFH